MAPSSKRRSARKRQPTMRQQAANNVDVNETPSRPAKRRRTNAAPPRPASETDAMEDIPDEDSSDGEETTALTEAADLVVPVLEEAPYVVNVAQEHPNTIENTGDGTISAYAKIAGRAWTYFVKDSTINIGRWPDQKQSSAPPSQADESHGEDEPTHIDLGPNKYVSRVHAKVFFESSDERWHVKVLGRNGLKVNDALVRRNQEKTLRSGDVLEIAGTEMIFVSPDVPAIVHETYTNRLNQPIKQERSNGTNMLPHSHPAAQTYQPPTHVSPYAPPADSEKLALAIQENLPESQADPMETILHAPYLAQNAASSAQLLPPPSNQPVAIESNEQPIDYSTDAVKHIKPPMSYATLISQAILAGPDEKSSLSGIYDWIKAHFSYYRHIEQGWQNSIRHNLSLNQAFVRGPRGNHEPGKGGLWAIADDRIDEFRNAGLKMTSRGGARQSSNPSSPTPKRSPKKKTPPGKTSPLSDGKSSFGLHGHSPDALASRPFHAGQPDMQTPSRAPRGSGIGLGVAQSLPQLSDDASPLRTRAPYLSQGTGTAGSPPTLSSSALFDDSNNTYSTIYTPAPQRHEPRLTAPSTVKLPSKYLPQSSPAPFWKNVGNTPLNLPDTSPAKAEADRIQLPQLQSSSPPPALANGSPTRPRAGTESRAQSSQGHPMLARPSNPVLDEDEDEDDDDDDDDQIDLMGQFPKIGERMVSSAAH